MKIYRVQAEACNVVFAEYEFAALMEELRVLLENGTEIYVCEEEMALEEFELVREFEGY